MKIDKVVTIYSNCRFDNHKGKQPGMVNAHLPLKMSPFSNPLCFFSKRVDVLSVSVILLQYQRQVLSDNFKFISQKE